MNRSTLAVVLLSSLVSSTAVFAATSATSVASSDKATLKNEATATSTASTTTQATKPKHATKHHKKCAKSKGAKHAAKEKSATAAITASSSTLAPQVAATPEFQQFCMRPQVTFWGLTGDATLGQTQMMLAGGDTKHAFYGFLEGTAIKDESAFKTGLGLGYRRASDAYFNTNNIYGIYVVGDYDRTSYGHSFWVANPGLEALGENWDFRLNGYFIIGDHEWKEGEGWMSDDTTLSTPERYKYVYIKGHVRSDSRYTLYTEAGNGGDIEVGHTFHNLHNLKLYAGGYYYHLEHNSDVKGGELRMELPVNHLFSVEAHETYDNYQHNTFLAGIKINLGGFNKQERESFGLSSRLMDPVVHNLDVYGREFPGAGAYTNREIAAQSVKNPNEWFFCPACVQSGANSHAGAGTYEDPFGNVDAQEIQEAVAASGGAPLTLSFETGQFQINATEFPGPTSSANQEFVAGEFVVPENTTIDGYETGFIAEAQGDMRPTFVSSDLPTPPPAKVGAERIFYGPFVVTKKNTTLANIKIINNNTSTEYAGIVVNGTAEAPATLRLINVSVPAASAESGLGFYDGLASNDATIEMNVPTSTSAITNDINGIEAGMLINRTIVNFNGGTNKITGTDLTPSFVPSSGVAAIDSTINFNKGNNFVKGLVSNSAGLGRGIAGSNNKIFFNGGRNTVTGEGYLGYGISGGNNEITFNLGLNTINAFGVATGIGIDALGYSAIRFNNFSPVYINANGSGYAVGLQLEQYISNAYGADGSILSEATIGNYAIITRQGPGADLIYVSGGGG